jgi:hypothetical protein
MFGIELPAQTAGPLALLRVWVIGYPGRWPGLGKRVGLRPVAAIGIKDLRIRQMRYRLENKHQDHPNQDGTMCNEEQNQHD